MNDEQLQKMIDDVYDDSKENSLFTMLGDFYNKKMLSIVIILWIDFFVFLGLAIFSAVKFFNTDLINYQIMYAAIFICCVQMVVLIKVFSWQLIHKNAIKREIKRLELRIVELTQVVKGK